MAIGDHLSVSFGLYTHHGIDCGDGTVIHFGRGIFDAPNAKIERVSRECFSQDRTITVKYSPAHYSAEEIVYRAFSRLGENGYDICDNNCEHFVNWCRSGESRSVQSDTTKSAIRQTTAMATRPFLKKTLQRISMPRSLGPALIVADIAQASAEVVAIRSGKSSRESEVLGAKVGAATSAGIGFAAAGPAGAAAGVGLWLAGQIVGRATVEAGKKALSNSSE